MKKMIKNLIEGVEDSFFLKEDIAPAFISLNIDGDLVIDGFKMLNSYEENKISVLANKKLVYVNGENLSLLYFTKSTIQIKGEISSIEIFKVI